MREIVSPLSGFGSPFGVRRAGSGGGAPAPTANFMLRDGNWQNLNEAVGVVHEGATYLSTITSSATDGNIEVHRWKDGAFDTFVVRANFIGNDHGSGPLLVLPDGRLMVAYNQHGGPEGTCYRISNQPLPNLEAGWGVEQYITGLNPTPLTNGTAYCYTFILGANLYVFRRGDQNAAVNNRPCMQMCVAPVADVIAGTPTWAISDFLRGDPSGQRAYITYSKSSETRIDMGIVDANLKEGPSALWHMYLDVSDGTPRFRRSDGTEITDARPFNNNVCTRVSPTGGTNRYLCQRVKRLADGRVVIIGRNFPSAATLALGPAIADTSDIQVQFFVCSPSGVWDAGTTVLDNQMNLPGDAWTQAGGDCFDGLDPTKYYVGERVGSAIQIRYYQMNYDVYPVTKTLIREVTSGPGLSNYLPFCPVGSSAVWWLQTTRTSSSFTNYDTNVWGEVVKPALTVTARNATYQAIYDRMTVKPDVAYPSLPVDWLWNRFVGEVTAGPTSGVNLLSKIVLHIQASTSLADARLNWGVGGAAYDLVNRGAGPSFTALLGTHGTTVTTDGLITQQSASAMTGVYAQNNFQVGGILGSQLPSPPAGADQNVVFSVDVSPFNVVLGRDTILRINEGSGATITSRGGSSRPIGPVFGADGIWSLRRANSTTSELWLDGFKSASDGTETSSGLTTGRLTISCRARARTKASWFGPALTAAESADLNMALYKLNRAMATVTNDLT